MKSIHRLYYTLAIFAHTALAGTLFLPAYPHALLVFDEAKGQIVDRIDLETGTPRSLKMSPDRRRIYVTTIDHNGIEIVDVTTRKVISRFVLNTATKQYRLRGGVADPSGKFFYTVSKEITKFPDHFEVAKAKYTIIDLRQQKIVKTVDIPAEDQYANEAGFGRYPFDISPDGKYLYHFGRKISVFRAEDFSLVDRIDLSQPEVSGMGGVHFGPDLPSIDEPGKRIALFVSSDPVVHAKVFGIGRFDLSTRDMNFNPISPLPGGMAGLQVTPDQKFAYTIVTTGAAGDKRCEFWAFDLSNDQIKQTREVPCRTRFYFGMSSDGKKLYIYGAGFEIEVYDTATLQLERTWDLGVDITPAGIAVLP